MNILLLAAALSCLVGAQKQPLKFTGDFHTLYLASNRLSAISENGLLRLYFRNISFYDGYKKMSVTFYMRENGTCRLYRLKAASFKRQNFAAIWHQILDIEPVKKKIDNPKGSWLLHNSYDAYPRGWIRQFYNKDVGTYVNLFTLEYVSETTMFLEISYLRQYNDHIVLIAAVSTGVELSKEMMAEYHKLTKSYGIPNQNIVDVTKTGDLKMRNTSTNHS